MTDSRSPTPRPPSRLSQALAEAMTSTRRREHDAVTQGLPALQRLLPVAEGHSGQSHHLRRLLLGLYNGYRWPFELHRLRALDVELQRDALSVITLATFSSREIHTLVEDGDAVMKRFWAREDNPDD